MVVLLSDYWRYGTFIEAGTVGILLREEGHDLVVQFTKASGSITTEIPREKVIIVGRENRQ